MKLTRLNFFHLSVDSGMESIQTEQMDNTENDPKIIEVISSSSSKMPVAVRKNEVIGQPIGGKSIPNQPKKYHCCIVACKYSTNRKESINRHQTSHIEKKPLSCNYCAKEFLYLRNLDHHKRSHVADFLFHCLVCLKECPTKDAANEHQRNCRIRRYECFDCKISIQHKNTLVEHLRKHSGMRPLSCKNKKCQKTFRQKSSLNRHIKLVHKKSI